MSKNRKKSTPIMLPGITERSKIILSGIRRTFKSVITELVSIVDIVKRTGRALNFPIKIISKCVATVRRRALLKDYDKKNISQIDGFKIADLFYIDKNKTEDRYG